MPNPNTQPLALDDSEIDIRAERELLLKYVNAVSGIKAARTDTASAKSVLFDAMLADREFASHLLRVADVMEWADEKGLSIDAEPDIRAFEFVQVEALLAAIERQTLATVTPEQALTLVGTMPGLSQHRVAGDPHGCQWILGGEAHLKWRQLLADAIDAGELRLLDFASKLPIDTPSARPPAHAPLSPGLATPEQLIEVFGAATGMNSRWFRNLGDRPGLKSG